ncbi:phage portal protein [Cucumibacter marinus]|uniref:phage portal protein n=1 Tax=Cucumibacter marinus TaxID=1121252 RepID=UPI000416468F|nr:phage portal protein [Cucumibacter marinus]
MKIWPFNRQPAVEAKGTLTVPDDLIYEAFGLPIPTVPVIVTPTTAMRCTPVRRAVQAIAEPIGQLPLHVYRRDGDKRERDREHPVAKVLRDPNEWTSAGEFREQLQRDCLLHGNGYAHINRVDGKVAELMRLDPANVRILVDTTSSEPTYEYQTGGGKALYPYRDIFHIKAPGTDGIAGKSPTLDCRDAIRVAMVMERQAFKFFEKASRPSGVIETPKQLGDEGVKKMLAGWKVAQQGAENAGGTPVLWDGSRFVSHTFNSVDAQFLELRRFAIDEIARVYGVPPHLLFEMGRATWGNAAELGAMFVTFVLAKWLKQWQGEIRLKLFAPEDRDAWYAEFLIDDLVRTDIGKRFTAYSQARSAEWMSANDIRAKENLPPIEGGNEYRNPNTSSQSLGGSDGNE